MASDFLDCLRILEQMETLELRPNEVRPREKRPTMAREARRRLDPRIPAPGGFCTEISEFQERYSMISDVSARGLRLHRPYSGMHSQVVQLELDLPGIDEVIWATGVVCFDSVWRGAEGQMLHTTGVELSAAAGRHLRMLREFAHDQVTLFGGYSERRALS